MYCLFIKLPTTLNYDLIGLRDYVNGVIGIEVEMRLVYCLTNKPIEFGNLNQISNIIFVSSATKDK